jgi:DivIVA domain-containing protein
MPEKVSFTVVLRGYDRDEVDAVMQHVNAALESDNPEVRASVRQELRDLALSVHFRGFDRKQVDEYLHQVTSQLTSS